MTGISPAIKIGDVVIAKAGCKAVGSITNAKAGMLGMLFGPIGMIKHERMSELRPVRR